MCGGLTQRKSYFLSRIRSCGCRTWRPFVLKRDFTADLTGLARFFSLNNTPNCLYSVCVSLSASVVITLSLLCNKMSGEHTHSSLSRLVGSRPFLSQIQPGSKMGEGNEEEEEECSLINETS